MRIGEHAFLKLWCFVEAAVSSDHALLFLHLLKPKQGIKRHHGLWYEKVWALDDGCHEMQAKAWRQPGLQCSGLGVLSEQSTSRASSSSTRILNEALREHKS
jgi:hypothetical protein